MEHQTSATCALEIGDAECDVFIKAMLLDGDIDMALDDIRNIATARNTTPVAITTMTVQAMLPDSTFSLAMLQERFSDPTIKSYVESLLKVPVTIKKNGAFHNCIILSYEENKAKRAVKVFSNGTLHITGLKTSGESLNVAETFCTVLSKINDKKYTVQDLSVQLINSYFKFVSLNHIALDKLYELLLSETQHLCRYNKENHAGIIICMLMDPAQGKHTCRKVSVIVFESGNILINAFVTAGELQIAYDFITEFIAKHIEQVRNTEATVAPTMKKTRKKRDDAFDYGKYIVLK
jgi:TATA-box binding protein (TBP) (component of TFIID and TFIIIB)